jgi:hypothetical protein
VQCPFLIVCALLLCLLQAPAISAAAYVPTTAHAKLHFKPGASWIDCSRCEGEGVVRMFAVQHLQRRLLTAAATLCSAFQQ